MADVQRQLPHDPDLREMQTQNDVEVSHPDARPEGRKKARKSHKKSRAGCHFCKRRKVKCDEAKPECEKCKRFGVPCDFLPRAEWELRTSTASSASQPSAERRRQGRPRGDWSRWAADLPHQSTSARGGSALSPRRQPASPSSGSPGSPSAELDVDDLLIFHHYLTVTAPTIGHSHIWRDGVPLLRKAYPGIFNAILSIAAYHLARCNVLHAPKYRTVADRHFEIAVKRATSMLVDVTVDNCQAVYAIITLVCFTAFAKGPEPGDLILVANEGRVAWFYLLRGVRMVLRTFGTPVVMSGVLDPNSQTNSPPNGCKCPPAYVRPREQRFELSHPGWDWHGSLERLSNLVSTSLEPELVAIFQPPIASITSCFQSLVQEKPASDDDNVMDFVSVMAWVYSIDEPFLEILEGRQQVGLIILGFFGVLLKSLKGFWWLDGWGDHVLQELRHTLGSEYEEWLP